MFRLFPLPLVLALLSHCHGWTGELSVAYKSAVQVERIDPSDLDSWQHHITHGIPAILHEPVSGPSEGERWECTSTPKLSNKDSGKLIYPSGSVAIKTPDVVVKELLSKKDGAPVIGLMLATTSFVASGTFLPSCAGSSLPNHVASSDASEFAIHTTTGVETPRAIVEMDDKGCLAMFETQLVGKRTVYLSKLPFDGDTWSDVSKGLGSARLEADYVAELLPGDHLMYPFAMLRWTGGVGDDNCSLALRHQFVDPTPTIYIRENIRGLAHNSRTFSCFISDWAASISGLYLDVENVLRGGVRARSRDRINQLDQNKDGVISITEFRSFRRKHAIDLDDSEEMEKVWALGFLHYHDVDGDGKVTVAEFKSNFITWSLELADARANMTSGDAKNYFHLKSSFESHGPMKLSEGKIDEIFNLKGIEVEKLRSKIEKTGREKNEDIWAADIDDLPLDEEGLEQSGKHFENELETLSSQMHEMDFYSSSIDSYVKDSPPQRKQIPPPAPTTRPPSPTPTPSRPAPPPPAPATKSPSPSAASGSPRLASKSDVKSGVKGTGGSSKISAKAGDGEDKREVERKKKVAARERRKAERAERRAKKKKEREARREAKRKAREEKKMKKQADKGRDKKKKETHVEKKAEKKMAQSEKQTAVKPTGAAAGKKTGKKEAETKGKKATDASAKKKATEGKAGEKKVEAKSAGKDGKKEEKGKQKRKEEDEDEDDDDFDDDFDDDDDDEDEEEEGRASKGGKQDSNQNKKKDTKRKVEL